MTTLVRKWFFFYMSIHQKAICFIILTFPVEKGKEKIQRCLMKSFSRTSITRDKEITKNLGSFASYVPNFTKILFCLMYLWLKQQR